MGQPALKVGWPTLKHLRGDAVRADGNATNSTHPKVLANIAKHFAFTRCGELNVFGMVDQNAVVENELLRGNKITESWKKLSISAVGLKSKL